MEEAKIHKRILDVLYEKVPHRATLTKELVDILCIEREAVYRRIRGEVPFTLNEMGILSRHFDFSIDNVISGKNNTYNHFQLYMDEKNPHIENDVAQLEVVLDVIDMIRNEPNSVLCSSSNTLPQSFFLNYHHLSRFYLFKWLYLYDDSCSVRAMGEVEFPHHIIEIQNKYAEEATLIKNSTYIWDYMIFQYLVNDLKYFESIKILSAEEVNLIKEELLDLLNYVEGIAEKGRFPNGNRVSFYISSINFDSSYSYIETPNLIASSIKAFTLNRITTVDISTFKRLKKWIQAHKRFSTLISESGEIQRVNFFEKQRELVRGI